MPKEIVVTERDAANRREQMKLMVGSPHQWFRIDKGDGAIVPVNGVAVVRAAQGAFKKPNHAIATGRFITTFAIYCSGDKMTAAEMEQAVR